MPRRGIINVTDIEVHSVPCSLHSSSRWRVGVAGSKGASTTQESVPRTSTFLECINEDESPIVDDGERDTRTSCGNPTCAMIVEIGDFKEPSWDSNTRYFPWETIMKALTSCPNSFNTRN
jgi:hypothetical protein